MATREAGEKRPSIRTIMAAAETQPSLRVSVSNISEDNMREHLSRHEAVWRDWNGP